VNLNYDIQQLALIKFICPLLCWLDQLFIVFPFKYLVNFLFIFDYLAGQLQEYAYPLVFSFPTSN